MSLSVRNRTPRICNVFRDICTSACARKHASQEGCFVAHAQLAEKLGKGKTARKNKKHEFNRSVNRPMGLALMHLP